MLINIKMIKTKLDSIKKKQKKYKEINLVSLDGLNVYLEVRKIKKLKKYNADFGSMFDEICKNKNKNEKIKTPYSIEALYYLKNVILNQDQVIMCSDEEKNQIDEEFFLESIKLYHQVPELNDEVYYTSDYTSDSENKIDYIDYPDDMDNHSDQYDH